QETSQAICNRNRTVPPSGASYPDYELSLPLLRVLWQEKPHKFKQLLKEGLRHLGTEHIVSDCIRFFRKRAPSVHIMGIRQKPYIKNKIRIHRYSMLESKGHYDHVNSLAGTLLGKTGCDSLAKLLRGNI